MNLTLCLTHDCAMACSYCYAGEKMPRPMSWVTAKRAIDFALAQSQGDFQLGFFGGEPLQKWSLLQKATVYAEEVIGGAGRKLVLTVTTNGIALSRERVAWLMEHHFYLGVSIDGNREMHDCCRTLRGGKSSFDAVLHGLKNALIRPDRVETVMVVDPVNVAHVPEGVAFLADLGVERISLNPNFYVEWDDESLAEWERAYERVGDDLLSAYRAGYPVVVNVLDSKIITRLKDGYSASDKCQFGCGEIAVAPSGNIYPCERLVGDDRGDGETEVCIGSVYEGYDMAKRVALLGRRGNQDLECVRCDLRDRCMNWCGCVNYTTTGTIDSAPGILCFHEKLSIRVADRVASILYHEKNASFLKRFYHV